MATAPGSMNQGPREWDAETYDRVSEPQFVWGMEVLDRLELRGDEYALDAGCGSGRVTAELLKRLPEGRVLAVDGSEAMIEKARENIGTERAEYLVCDLSKLEVPEPVDLVFSTATFHWIPDHDVLFARIREALAPGGRLFAQCGGAGNVARHAAVIASVASRPEFAEHYSDMEVMWNFATAEDTAAKLENAGFTDVKCSLEPKDVTPEDARAFVTTVTLGPRRDGVALVALSPTEAS